MKLLLKILLFLLLWALFAAGATWLLRLTVPIQFKLECNITSPLPLQISLVRPDGEITSTRLLAGAVGTSEVNLRFPLGPAFRKTLEFEIEPPDLPNFPTPPPIAPPPGTGFLCGFSLGEATYALCGVEFLRLRRGELQKILGSENIFSEIASRALQLRVRKFPARFTFPTAPHIGWAYPVAGLLFGLPAAILTILALSARGRAVYRKCGHWWGTHQPAVLVGAFLTMLLGPMLLHDLLPSDAPAGNREQRQLAPPPEFRLRRIQGFPSQFTRWYDDHFPFRSDLVALNTRLTFDAGSLSPTPIVMLGENGMLFFNSKVYERSTDSLGDYLHKTRFSPRELHRIGENLERIDRYCRAREMRFQLLIPPNKSTVYPDRMRLVYRTNVIGHSRVEQLAEYLKHNHPAVEVIVLEPALRAARSKIPEQLYYDSDTHWNHLGAYVAFREWAGRTVPALDTPPAERLKLTNRKDFYGDLWRLMNASRRYDDNYLPEIPGVTYDTKRYVLGGRFEERNDDAPSQLRMVWFRDSYSNFLAPFLRRYFRFTELVSGHMVSPQTLGATKPDIVVLEVLERYLDRLLNAADLIPPDQSSPKLKKGVK